MCFDGMASTTAYRYAHGLSRGSLGGAMHMVWEGVGESSVVNMMMLDADA